MFLNENFRRVTKDRAREFANKYNLVYFDECSAKENSNISEIFGKLYKSNINKLKYIIDIYEVKKDKLVEKTNETLKFLDSKKADPKSQCC